MLRTRHQFLILLVILVITRMVVFLMVYPEKHRLYNGDSWLYEQYALSMLETGSYMADGYGTINRNPFADMIRPPGLPVVMVAVYAIAGPEAGPWFMILPSLAASALLIAIMLLILRTLSLQQRWPVLFILVLDPVWMFYTKELITEPYFTPLFMLAIWLVIRIFQQSKHEHQPDDFLAPWSKGSPLVMAAGAGAVLGVATLFKPITFYAPWIGAVYLLIALVYTGTAFPQTNHVLTNRLKYLFNHPATCKKHLILAAVFLFSAQLFIFSWQVRNYAAHQTLVFTSISAENMMTGHAVFALAGGENLTHQQALHRIQQQYQSQNPDEDSYSFREQNQAKMAVAGEIISQYRFSYFKAIMRGLGATLLDPGRQVLERTFSPAYTGDPATSPGLLNAFVAEGAGPAVLHLMRENPAKGMYYGFYMLFLIGLTAASAFGAFRMIQTNPLAGLLIVGACAYLLILGSIGGYARFRMYLLPLMILMLACVFKTSPHKKDIKSTK